MRLNFFRSVAAGSNPRPILPTVVYHSTSYLERIPDLGVSHYRGLTLEWWCWVLSVRWYLKS